MADPTMDNDDLGDDLSLAARMTAPVIVPQVRNSKEEKPDAVAKEIASQGDSTLAEFFKSLSGTSIKLSLIRTRPDFWDGRQVSGHLGSFDELLDEDAIAERFGGGTFQVKVQKILPSGKYQYAGARTIKVAGDPKVTGEHFKDRDPKEAPVVVPVPVPTSENADVTKAAMATMERFASKAVDRAEKIEENARGQSPFDPTILALVTKPLESQIASLNGQLAAKDQLLMEKDRIIKELSDRRPDTTMQDRMLDKMYDGENAKLNALRMQHDAERRVLQENFNEEKKRMEHRSDTERQNLMEAHKRELKQMEMSYEHQLKASDLSHKGLLDAKENRVKDLERTITRQDSEIAELRAKKEKTLIEQASELAHVQETFKALGMGGPEGPEEQTTVERVMGAIAENPIVMGIGKRLSQPEPQRLPPRPAPARPPVVQQKRQRAREALQGAPQAPQPPQPAPQPPRPFLPPGVSQDDVQTAVQMMEGAVANATEPDIFAQSIRGMVPTGVVNYIQTHGIDSLLDGVARLSEASPLQTQVGRNFARRVAKALSAA